MMTRPSKTILFALSLCICMTVASGIVRGRLSQRWGPSPDMIAGAERIAQMPETIGNWHCVKSSDLDEETKSMLQCTGSLFRIYQHVKTGQTVSVVMLNGPSGPLAVHTPDVCYRSSNFSITENTRQIEICDTNSDCHNFLTISFRENDIDERPLRVYFGWNRTGEWEAPTNPRSHFAGSKSLYKLQVATRDLGGSEAADAAIIFIKEALPILHDIYDNCAKKSATER